MREALSAWGQPVVIGSRAAATGTRCWRYALTGEGWSHAGLAATLPAWIGKSLSSIAWPVTACECRQQYRRSMGAT